MAKNDRLSPENIIKVLSKKKYQVSGKPGVNKTRLKANGRQEKLEGAYADHVLTLELVKQEDKWIPVPPIGDDFTTAPSILRSEEGGCFTRAYIRNLEDLERILIRLGALEPIINPVVEKPVKKTAGAKQEVVKPVNKETKKAIKKSVKKVAKKPVKKAVAKKATSKKAVKKVVKKTVKKTVKKGAAKIVRKAAKKTVKKAGVRRK
jgi:hypothetical protein